MKNILLLSAALLMIVGAVYFLLPQLPFSLQDDAAPDNKGFATIGTEDVPHNQPEVTQQKQKPAYTCAQATADTGLVCVAAAELWDIRGDAVAALDLLGEACVGGDGRACYLRGIIHRDRGEFSLMRKYYEEGCALSYALACFNRKVVMRSIEKLQAVGMLEAKKCSQNDATACHNLAVLQREIADTDKAMRYAHKACDQDVTESCLAAGEMLRRSQGLVPAYREYISKACTAKVDTACELLQSAAAAQD